MQLKRLGVSQIDYYLAHNLNINVWKPMLQHGLFKFFDEAVKDGRIRFPSFSFHDEYALFEEIIKASPWCRAQVLSNYLDIDGRAGWAGVKLAHERGAAVVVMEPLRGGFLVNLLPDAPKAALAKARPEWSLAAWCLNWLWSQPEVSVVLSGMSDMAQTDDNVATAQAWRPGKFTPEDEMVTDGVREWFAGRLKATCTACGYCLPCASGVEIPKNIGYLNDYFMFEDPEAKDKCKAFYKMLVLEKESAAACTDCGECLEKCPQHLEIPRLLEEAARIFMS
jgi:predicted aldo/keto reductase-like oxidoreductase